MDEQGVITEVRLGIFRDTMRMIAANPWGVGPSRYRDVFRQYQTERPDLLFDHAHNDYLESAAEWGIPLALLFWGLIVSVLLQAVRAFWRSQSPERRGVLLAASGAMVSILVHSLTDFNLHIPSNAMLFFIFVGIAIATIHMSWREC